MPSASVNGYISFVWLNAGMAHSYLSVYTVSGGVPTLVGSTANLSSTATGHERMAVSGFTRQPAASFTWVPQRDQRRRRGPVLPQRRVERHLPPSTALPAAATRYAAVYSSYTSPPSSFTLSVGSVACPSSLVRPGLMAGSLGLSRPCRRRSD
jgi:hypothetical protein